MAKQSTSKQATQSKAQPAATSNDVQAAYIFTDALKAHADEDANAFAFAMAEQFDERVQFEITRTVSGSADMPKVKKLNAYRAKLAVPSLAKVMMELKIAPAFINSTHSKDASGDRFNIYAIEKAIDLVRALAQSVKPSNPSNLAITRSLLNFEEAGAQFTAEMALCAASDKIRSQDSNVKLLKRHTLDKNTAGTQASSTLRALQALGLIINTGTKRAATYVFANTNQAEAFKELLRKA